MSSASSTVLLSNIVNQMPTGTFLTFQTLAPLFTNNGQCGKSELAMTGGLMLVFVVLCSFLCFTDSFTTPDGHVFYGIVTTRGLFNPLFKHFSLDYARGSFYTGPPQFSKQFYITGYDFFNAFVTVICFCTLSLTTAPLNQCLYGSLPSSISKGVPVLVAVVALLFFSFAPPARRGLGFGVVNTGPHFLQYSGPDPPVAPAPSSKLMTTMADSDEIKVQIRGNIGSKEGATSSRYTMRDYLSQQTD